MDLQVSRVQGGAGATQLKTPYRGGTTHVIFEPLDFIARLAVLVSNPRVNLMRFHGVFAPNSQYRALVTPAKRGKGNKAKGWDEPPTTAERRASMTWAQRLKRVFNIEIATCQTCGGALRIIACVEDPVVIKKIPSFGASTLHPCTTPLTHLDKQDPSVEASPLPPSRAPL